MFYRKVYPKAWQLAKKNPNIWFFGLFASLLGFYEIKALFNISDSFPDFISSNIKSWFDIFITFSTVDLTWASMPDLLALFGLFALFSIVTILAISSQATLTYFASSKGAKAAKLSIGEQLKHGVDKFWPVFGLNIINSLIGYFFVSLVVTPLIYFLSNTNDWPMYIILGLFTFFVLVPMVVTISFVTRYGIAYVVIKNQKFTDAFVNSWILFRANWIITLENAVLLLIMTVLALIAIISAMIFTLVPFFIMTSILPFLGLMIMIIGFFLVAVVLIVSSSIYSAFYNIVWANIFMELTSPGKSHGKIHRTAHKHMPELTK